MMAKILKSVIVVAAALTFFGGTAMADGWGRDYHHNKGHHSHWKHHQRHHSDWRQPQRGAYYHDSYREERHARVAPPRHDYRESRHYASESHPLAPRIVFFGGLPVPVPPPPNEVLDYLTGR